MNGISFLCPVYESDSHVEHLILRGALSGVFWRIYSIQKGCQLLLTNIAQPIKGSNFPNQLCWRTYRNLGPQMSAMSLANIINRPESPQPVVRPWVVLMSRKHSFVRKVAVGIQETSSSGIGNKETELVYGSHSTDKGSRPKYRIKVPLWGH